MLPRLSIHPARWRVDLRGCAMKTVEEIIGMFGGVDGLYVSITTNRTWAW
jgi:hypothetical protein